jgi:hypothetical protein
MTSVAQLLERARTQAAARVEAQRPKAEAALLLLRAHVEAPDTIWHLDHGQTRTYAMLSLPVDEDIHETVEDLFPGVLAPGLVLAHCHYSKYNKAVEVTIVASNDPVPACSCSP